MARILESILFAMIWKNMTPEEITEYLFLEDEDQTGDIAIVFGTRIWRQAIKKALELYFSGKVKKLVLTGGVNDHSGEEEAENMYKVALEKSVPEKDLILEKRATNTLENVLFSKKLIEEKIGWENIKTACGVMVNVHARRALMTMKKHFPKRVKLKACPYFYCKDGIKLGKNGWHNDPVLMALVMRQLQKVKDYLAKGDIEELY